MSDELGEGRATDNFNPAENALLDSLTNNPLEQTGGKYGEKKTQELLNSRQGLVLQTYLTLLYLDLPIPSEFAQEFDSTNSRFLVNHDFKNMTKRETIISFLDQYFYWSDEFHFEESRSNTVGKLAFYKAYKEYVSSNNVPLANRAQSGEFSDYILLFTTQERLKITNEFKNVVRKEAFVGLPHYRTGIDIPDFDMGKHIQQY